MRAIVCTALSGHESLELQDLPEPKAPGPDEVLVQAHAWGVNYVDVLMCRGGYQLKPDPPFVPGMEAAGEILAIGEEVSDWSTGDRVITKHRPGAFQDRHVLKASALWPIPTAMDYAAAASFQSAAITAYHAMVDRGRLEPGETILVHGATGGVGLAAVQLGKALGATVIATGANPEKLMTVQAMGADHVLTSTAGFRDKVKELTDGRGVDLVYDPVGGDIFDESIRCLAWEGRIIVVGFVSGRAAEAKTNHLLIKGASVIGIRAGEGARQKPERGAASKAALLALAKTGKLDPHISHRFPLEGAPDAFRAIDAREVIGKAVLMADC